jgi:hypothetical protein
MKPAGDCPYSRNSAAEAIRMSLLLLLLLFVQSGRHRLC